MPTPFAPRIIVSQNARTDLQALARAHSTPQSFSLRARIVLRAAAIDTPTNLHIGRDLGCTNRTVGKWRQRFVALGFSGWQDAARSGRPRTLVSSTHVHEIVGTLLDALHTQTISRSSVWRILHAIDLKPHKSAYWLNRHEAPCDAKARAICQLYVQALEAYQHGHLVICCDEKTGRQVLERTAPTTPAQPGRRERREHADSRRGPRVLINSLAVATGHIAWTLGATRKTADFVAHLKHVYQSLPPLPH